MKFPFACLIATLATLSFGNSWNQWRGPYGTGVGNAKDLPTEFGNGKNVAWSIELPSWSGSSPILTDDRVFVISPSAEDVEEVDESGEIHPRFKRKRQQMEGDRSGGKIAGPGGDDLLLLCLSREDGSILWQRKMDTGNAFRLKQNSSTPSPVSDGKRVWTVTANGVVNAFTIDGESLWTKNITDDYGPLTVGFGYATSPLLFEGKLIFQVIHGWRGDSPSYLLALDATTGDEVWHVRRATDASGECKDAYTTPTISTHNGKSHIVVLGADYATGHSPKTGKEVWRLGGLNPEGKQDYRIISSPLAIDGMIYAPTRNKPLLAFKAGGKGDISKSHLVWKWDAPGSPDVPTIACDGEYLYMVEDAGRMTCVDAKSGDTIWGPEDLGIGRVTASPIIADGKLYTISESAEVAVVKTGRVFERLSVNTLDGGYTISSPAADGNQLFFRSANRFFCVSAD